MAQPFLLFSLIVSFLSSFQKRASSPTADHFTPPITPQRSNRRTSMTPPSTGGSRRGTNTIYSDRFIPSRTTTNLEEAFDLLGNKYNHKETTPKTEGNTALSSTPNAPSSSAHAESQMLMNNLLRSELLGQPALDFAVDLGMADGGGLKSPTRRESGSSLFKYRLSQGSTTSMESSSTLGGMSGGMGVIDEDDRRGSGMGMDIDDRGSGFGLTASPAGSRSSYLSPGKKTTRKIPKTPYKILDAPSLQDDYYLNLVDWSHNNVLAVALCSCVYLWSACTSKVSKLCDFGSSDMVTSISWALSGNQIAVGMNSGKIQIWDSTTCKMIRELQSHESRVGALAWNNSLLASGSRDRSIYLQDIRVKSNHRASSFGGGNSSGTSSVHSGSHRDLNQINTTTPSATMSSTSGFTSGFTTLPAGDVSTGSRSLITTMAESMVPHTAATASNSDDTFPFTDPMGNITTSITAPITTTPSRPSDFLSSPRRSSGLLSTTFTPDRISFDAIPVPSTPNGLNGSIVRELHGHKQEVCGLRWSFDEKMLASGGNDNKLYVWEPQLSNNRKNDPLHRFEDHTAAVKAVAWSPHQQGLLASGGGTADRHIRFWNASTGLALHKVDTGSQVCLFPFKFFFQKL